MMSRPGISAQFAGNCKKSADFGEVSRLFAIPSGFSESFPEISKVVYLFEKRDGNSEKSD
jgi:hypothetical protein